MASDKVRHAATMASLSGSTCAGAPALLAAFAGFGGMLIRMPAGATPSASAFMPRCGEDIDAAERAFREAELMEPKHKTMLRLSAGKL